MGNPAGAVTHVDTTGGGLLLEVQSSWLMLRAFQHVTGIECVQLGTIRRQEDSWPSNDEGS